MKRLIGIGICLVVILAILAIYIGCPSKITEQPVEKPKISKALPLVEEAPQVITYTVVKGDCLWNISYKQFKNYGVKVNDWVRLKDGKAMEIKNKDKIYPGWTIGAIVAKEAAKKKGAQKATKPLREIKKKAGFSWLHPNRNPFGLRDKSKMIDKFNVPNWIKEEWKKKIAAGEYESFIIYNGLHFNEMAFNNYKKEEKVTVLWLERYSKVTRQAKVYIAEDGGIMAYYLVDPEVCHNLGWWEEETEAAEIKKKEEKKEEIITPPKPVEEIKKPEEKEEKPVVVTKQGEPKLEEAKEEKPAVAAKKELPKKCRFSLSYEASIFGGVYEFPEGWGGEYGFWGTDTSFFVANCATPKSRFKIGPSFQYLRWNGEIGNNRTGFQGQRQLYGLEGQYLTVNTKTSLKFRRGVKHSHSATPKGLYLADEKAIIWSYDFYHQKWYQRKWFSLMEVGARADFAFKNRKRSTVNGEVLTYAQDPPVDQSEYFIRGRADIYKGKLARPFIEIPVGYRAFDRNYLVEPTLGLKFFKEALEIKSSYQWVEGRDNNAFGVLGVINLHNIPKNFKKGVKK